MDDRKKEEILYEDFLEEPDEEKKFRDKVLKPGVVHRIHLAGDTVPDTTDLSNYYTKAEINTLLAALGVLTTCFVSLDRHNFLMYDEINSCWKNQPLDMDFEDSINYTCTNMWQALCALIRIEDSYFGEGITIEDSL